MRCHGTLGETIIKTEMALRELHGSNINAALIGPAGERLSHMAAVMNDEHRAAARGGSGSVMGSKKLKAVVVRGNQKTEMAYPEKVVAINKEINVFMSQHVRIFQHFHVLNKFHRFYLNAFLLIYFDF